MNGPAMYALISMRVTTKLVKYVHQPRVPKVLLHKKRQVKRPKQLKKTKKNPKRRRKTKRKRSKRKQILRRATLGILISLRASKSHDAQISLQSSCKLWR